LPEFKYRRVPDEDMPDAEAEWNSAETEISMRESVFTGMQRGDTHPRFVVFHELSHFALGHQGMRNRVSNSQVRRYSAATGSKTDAARSLLGTGRSGTLSQSGAYGSIV
jgi:hypothetical protein